MILCVTHFVMWLVEGREFGIEKIRLQSLLILSIPGHSKAKKCNRETKKKFPSAAKILPNFWQIILVENYEKFQYLFFMELKLSPIQNLRHPLDGVFYNIGGFQTLFLKKSKIFEFWKILFIMRFSMRKELCAENYSHLRLAWAEILRKIVWFFFYFF